MKIIVIGSSILETTCQIKGSFKEGDNVILDNRIETGGGVAGNIAYVLGKWGAETYIASMLGADDFANKIKKEFESVGVRIDYIETSYDKTTGQSLVLVNSANKEVTKFDILSNSFLKKYSFAVEPDIIVTDGNDYNATIATFDRYSKAQSYFVVKKVDQYTDNLCRYAKYLIFNKNTAEIVSNSKIDFGNSSTIVNTYNRLKQKYSEAEIIITLGEKGSVYSMNSNVKIMPPIKMDVVDPNGACEIYSGALIYGMANNFGLERSVAYATIAASISVSRLSARNSVPSLNEVSSYYDGKFGAQNNPNKTVINDNNANATNTVNNTTNTTNTTPQPAPQTQQAEAPVAQPQDVSINNNTIQTPITNSETLNATDIANNAPVAPNMNTSEGDEKAPVFNANPTTEQSQTTNNNQTPGAN